MKIRDNKLIYSLKRNKLNETLFTNDYNLTDTKVEVVIRGLKEANFIKTC